MSDFICSFIIKAYIVVLRALHLAWKKFGAFIRRASFCSYYYRRIDTMEEVKAF